MAGQLGSCVTGAASANHSAECRARIVRAMRADEELGERVLEAERRVLRATEVKAAEERRGLQTTDVKAAEEKKVAEEKEDAVMGSDMRAIDDAEALK
eukprot:4477952-Amphidinium_carterae.1